MTAFASPSAEWEIEITHDGMWPFRWRWHVTRILRYVGPPHYESSHRHGDSLTKDRARREALKAKRSIEEDDVLVRYA